MHEFADPAPKTSRPWLRVLVVLGVIALLCCGGVLIFVVPEAVEFASSTPEEQQARLSGMVEKLAGDQDVVARTFIDRLSADEIDEALALGSASFQANVGREGLETVDRKIDAVLGGLNELHLFNFNIQKNGFGAGNKSIDLVYQGEFENGDGTITMRLVESADGTMHVESYRVNSPLFLDDIAPDADAGAAPPDDE